MVLGGYYCFSPGDIPQAVQYDYKWPSVPRELQDPIHRSVQHLTRVWWAMTTNIELPTVASILVAPRVPIFDPDWTADEEIALLEALKNYGFANWGYILHACLLQCVLTFIRAVSNDIRGKTPAQCAEHYQAAYLGIGEYSSEESISAPMEKNAIDFALLESFLKDELDLSGMKLQLAMRQEQRAAADADETSDGADTPSAAPSRRRQSIGRPPKAKAQATIPPELQSDIAGFMPLRRDFDVEHDNDAELVIADMKFAEVRNMTPAQMQRYA